MTPHAPHYLRSKRVTIPSDRTSDFTSSETGASRPPKDWLSGVKLSSKVLTLVVIGYCRLDRRCQAGERRARVSSQMSITAGLVAAVLLAIWLRYNAGNSSRVFSQFDPQLS